MGNAIRFFVALPVAAIPLNAFDSVKTSRQNSLLLSNLGKAVMCVGPLLRR